MKLFAVSAVLIVLVVLAWGHSSGSQVEADTPVTWTIQVDPAGPTVGDAVQVTVSASGTGGIAGIPAYTLKIVSGDSVLALQSPPSISVNQLGVPVTWDLTAVQAGQATLRVNVSYEKQFCDETGCIFNFTSAVSPVIPVKVTGVSVGGISADGELRALPLETDGLSGTDAGVPAGVIAGGSALALTLIGAAWYMRRRWSH